MNKQHVDMVMYESLTQVLTRSSCTWLPSFLYPILDYFKTKIESIIPTASLHYRKATIDLSDIIELVLECEDQIFRYRNRRPREIFIGYNELRRLKCEELKLRPWDYMDINLEHPRLLGIKLTIVPWMSGVLVV